MGEKVSEPPDGKPWFPTRIRQLRVDAGKRQRDVAEAIGCKETTYANAESAHHKRLTERRVLKLAAFYRLSSIDTDELLTGWRAMPLSDYSQANAPKNERRRVMRDKVKAHDEMKVSLLEVTTLLATTCPEPEQLCTCRVEGDDDFFAEPPPPCTICNALQLLGLPRWSTLDDVVGRLAAAQEALVQP